MSDKCNVVESFTTIKLVFLRYGDLANFVTQMLYKIYFLLVATAAIVVSKKLLVLLMN